MLVIRARIHKMFVRIANREDPDQTASSEAVSDMGLHCLSKLFWPATSVRNFRTFTVLWRHKETSATLQKTKLLYLWL